MTAFGPFAMLSSPSSSVSMPLILQLRPSPPAPSGIAPDANAVTCQLSLFFPVVVPPPPVAK